MSAQLASQNSFSANLALAAGVAVSIHAPTMADLAIVVGKLTEAANTADMVGRAAPSPTTAPVAGNALVPTATPASAPVAASGSVSGGDTPQPTYDDVKSRVLSVSKALGRETVVALLGQYKSAKNEPVDHGNKLQLQDYASFIASADQALASAPKA